MFSDEDLRFLLHVMDNWLQTWRKMMFDHTVCDPKQCEMRAALDAERNRWDHAYANLTAEINSRKHQPDVTIVPQPE